MRITRRRFLDAAIGLSAGLAGCGVDALRGTSEITRHRSRLLAMTTGVHGHVGATVPESALQSGCYSAGQTQDQADAAWEAAVGRRMAATKKFNRQGQFPADLTVNNIGRYIGRGVKVCVTFKPAFNLVSATDRQNLAATLNLYKSSGLNADVALWQEAGDAANRMSPKQYQQVYEYYGPTVRRYFPLVADLSFANEMVSNYTDYANLVTGLVDKFAIDYYYNAYQNSKTTSVPACPLDAAADIADSVGLPFGIWEFNTGGVPPSAPDQSHGTAFMHYVQKFMEDRLSAGKANAEVMFYDGTCDVFEPNGQPIPILSPSDYRIPLYQQLWDMLSPPTALATLTPR